MRRNDDGYDCRLILRVLYFVYDPYFVLLSMGLRARIVSQSYTIRIEYIYLLNLYSSLFATENSVRSRANRKHVANELIYSEYSFLLFVFHRTFHIWFFCYFSPQSSRFVFHFQVGFVFNIHYCFLTSTLLTNKVRRLFLSSSFHAIIIADGCCCRCFCCWYVRSFDQNSFTIPPVDTWVRIECVRQRQKAKTVSK